MWQHHHLQQLHHQHLQSQLCIFDLNKKKITQNPTITTTPINQQFTRPTIQYHTAPHFRANFSKLIQFQSNHINAVLITLYRCNHSQLFRCTHSIYRCWERYGISKKVNRMTKSQLIYEKATIYLIISKFIIFFFLYLMRKIVRFKSSSQVLIQCKISSSYDLLSLIAVFADRYFDVWAALFCTICSV